MREAIPIRDYATIYPSGTVWVHSDGSAGSDTDFEGTLLSWFRIHPVEAINAPNIDEYIHHELEAQADAHPDRVRRLLQTHRHTFFQNSQGNDAHRAFIEFASQILSIEEPEAVMQHYVRRERVQSGSGIEAFVDYAREQARALADNPDVIAEIKHKLGKGSAVAAMEQQHMEQVIGALPPYYGQALKRMGGIEIAVNEDQNVCHEDSGLLGIETRYARDAALLKATLPEEIQHFMDYKLGFTDTAAWRGAVNEQYAFRMKATPMYEMALHQLVSEHYRPDAVNENEIVAGMAEQLLRAMAPMFPDLTIETAQQDLWLNWIGEKREKSVPFGFSYRGLKGDEAVYKELLPDVLLELHKHMAAGETPEAACAATGERYGRLAELAMEFEKAVEQFAETGRPLAESFKGRSAAASTRGC